MDPDRRARERAQRAVLGDLPLSPPMAALINRYGIHSLRVLRASDVDAADPAFQTLHRQLFLSDRILTVVLRERDGWVVWDSRPSAT